MPHAILVACEFAFCNLLVYCIKLYTKYNGAINPMVTDRVGQLDVKKCSVLKYEHEIL